MSARVFYPALSDRQSITVDQLVRLDDPCVIFEGTHVDSDNVVGYIYTVGGYLNGAAVGGAFGVLVGDDAIIVHAESRGAADAMASDGLLATIDAIRNDRTAERSPGGIITSVDSIGRGAKH